MHVERVHEATEGEASTMDSRQSPQKLRGSEICSQLCAVPKTTAQDNQERKRQLTDTWAEMDAPGRSLPLAGHTDCI